MKTRSAARELFNHFMSALSRREIDLQKTISEWDEIRNEIKKEGGKTGLADFILLNALTDLKVVSERKEQVQHRAMEFFQEIAIAKISELEVDDELVERLIAEGTA